MEREILNLITILPEAEMKDASIILLETLFRWYHAEEKIGFLGQIRSGSQKPAEKDSWYF